MNSPVTEAPEASLDGDLPLVKWLGFFPPLFGGILSSRVSVTLLLPLRVSISHHIAHYNPNKSMGMTQDPRLIGGTDSIYMFGLFFRPKFQGISPQHMAWQMVLTYLDIKGSWRSPIDIGGNRILNITFPVLRNFVPPGDWLSVKPTNYSSISCISMYFLWDVSHRYLQWLTCLCPFPTSRPISYQKVIIVLNLDQTFVFWNCTVPQVYFFLLPTVILPFSFLSWMR